MRAPSAQRSGRGCRHRGPTLVCWLNAVDIARTRIMALSVARSDGRSTSEVPPLHGARGDHEIEVIRDDLARILFDAATNDTEVVVGDANPGHS
jgi:hypothetical protein